MYVCMYVYMYIYLSIYLSIYLYVYIYIYIFDYIILYYTTQVILCHMLHKTSPQRLRALTHHEGVTSAVHAAMPANYTAALLWL